VTDVASFIEITATPDVLYVGGEVDAAGCGALRAAIIANGFPESVPIRLDMSQVAFMDSSGIGVLIERFKTHDAGVVIMHPSPSVARVLKLTGLYERFVDPAAT
jgi:anti-sigma B factor antagonist